MFVHRLSGLEGFSLHGEKQSDQKKKKIQEMFSEINWVFFLGREPKVTGVRDNTLELCGSYSVI